jgi:hypothetical protein
MMILPAKAVLQFIGNDRQQIGLWPIKVEWRAFGTVFKGIPGRIASSVDAQRTLRVLYRI